MGVYVDDAIWPWRGEMWCHLLADTDAELAAFADRLGLETRWLQHKPARPWLDHYDLPDYARDQAIKLGATPVTRSEIVRVIRAKRELARRSASLPPSSGSAVGGPAAATPMDQRAGRVSSKSCRSSLK